VRRIDDFVEHYNATACPFAWTVTADSILAKLEWLLKAINGTAHSPATSTVAPPASHAPRLTPTLLK
jgi:hypothetical protein